MLTHIRGCIADYHHTGSPFRSSNHFARVMTSAIRENGNLNKPKRILEVGPGAGPMTRQIVRDLQHYDEFDVVEVNPIFVKRVDEAILEPTRKRLPNTHIKIHQGLIQDIDLKPGYDVIVSCLPLNNFPIEVVCEILDVYKNLLKPDGELSYYEFALIRDLGRKFSSSKTCRQRLSHITNLYRIMDKIPGVKKKLVTFNLPPAVKRSIQPRALFEIISSVTPDTLKNPC